MRRWIAAGLVLAAIASVPVARAGNNPFVGEIAMYGTNYPPRNWADCSGQLLYIGDYSTLFSLIGSLYGGDGSTTFRLPNLNGRVPVGQGSAPGLLGYYGMGYMGGNESIPLSASQMPAHNHTAATTLTSLSLRAHHTAANSLHPDGGVLAQTNSDGAREADIYSSAAPNVSMDAQAVSLTGGGATVVGQTGAGTTFSTVQPYTVVRFCIALVGIFPVRP